MSHGWGSNVLVEIQQTLLGVRPTSPGYTSFAVSPPATGLEFATGTVPTPAGAIAVAWRRGGATGRELTLDVTVPANTTATVSIPAHGNAQLRLAAGTHHFESG